MISYEKLRIQARLTISVKDSLGQIEDVQVPLSSIRANHDENGIPFCVVTVATGRDAQATDSLDGLSPIHLISDKIRIPAKALVELKVTVDDAAGERTQVWPDDFFTVFDGRVADLSSSVSMGSSNFTIRLIHWLSDLDFCSPYSEDAFPNTPSDFLFNAATVFGTGTQRAVLGSTSVQMATAYFTPNTVADDFWSSSETSGLRPFLEAVAEERLMNWRQVQLYSQVPGPEGVRTNRLMLSALEKFEPLFAEDVGESFYEYGVPLKLRDDLSGFGQLASRISFQISEMARSPLFLGGTIWDRMVSGLSSQFMFSIIPMVDRALTVPYTPWQRDVWAVIENDEFDVIDYSVQARRPIKAVAVVGAYGSYTGLRADQQIGGITNGERQVMGYFEPAATDVNNARDGMTLYVEAPAWVNDLLMHGVSSYTAPSDAKFPLSSSPSSSLTQDLEDELNQLVDDKVSSGESLANALAQATYLQETTKWRQLLLSTALRFDIGPGSSIAIRSSPDRMVRALLNDAELADNEELVGRVVRVSWSVDLSGQTASASTTFHIAYLRSSVENEDAAFSAGDHPIWSQRWLGAPLVGLTQFSH